MSTYYIVNEDELSHYGVRGMKWGVRKAIDRYYDSDGRRFDRKTRATIEKARNRGASRKSISNYQQARENERKAYIRNSKAARKVDSSFGRGGSINNWRKSQNALATKHKATSVAKKQMMKSGKVKASSVSGSKQQESGWKIAAQYGLIGYAISRKKRG